MKEKINFAVIGCGHIGKRHAEMIQRNEEANLLALVDVQPKDTLGLGVLSDVPFYNTIEEALSKHPEIDVVNIATPNGFHAEQALTCLDAKKHVVIEKPMALTKNDAEKVIF